MRKKRSASFLLFLLLGLTTAFAQLTAPVNGVADNRQKSFAFINAMIVKDASSKAETGTLLIKDGKITGVGKVNIPADAIVIDVKGKYIYPSFIDLHSDYGVAAAKSASTSGGFNFNATPQITTNTKGAYGWNEAIKSFVNAGDIFTMEDKTARDLRSQGFGSVLTHQKDGIARGTGSFVTLASTNDNFVMLKEKASANFSFNSGTSRQTYPRSMMGSIALLRQTFLDAQWYKNIKTSPKGLPVEEGINKSLEAWNSNLSLPLIFEANDKWNDLRADRIGDEFGYQFILKAGGNEYERMKEMKATNAAFILPLEFPKAMDVEDPNEARFVSLGDLKHWEMAPSNPAAFEKAGIKFCFTSSDLKDVKSFMAQIRKAINYGLSEEAALKALTTTPASLVNMYNEVGSLENGKLANFLISSGPLFEEKTQILQNWVQGEKYEIKEDLTEEVKGIYTLSLVGEKETKNFLIEVKNNKSAMLLQKDSLPIKFNFEGKQVSLVFGETKKQKNTFRLSGIANGQSWSGLAVDSSGQKYVWNASFKNALLTKKDSAAKKEAVTMGTLTYPNSSYGFKELPKQENILFTNATVWTNEAEGVLQNADVWINNGKIMAVGKNLKAPNAKIINAEGKHITAGIIDEHSHIAAASINEGGQSVTSEVRIADNIYPDDVDIYRQLSGGVTSSHILHGSANTIGGQTQLIKLRWGANDEDLKFKGADGFIKFALGENVKRTGSRTNNRFPDTRMGVQQVQLDAFTRAKEYEAALKGPNAKFVRKDLELDALVEIMNSKRFITCHSYVQSEIVETMRIAEKFGFTINTFTHILEGYKVADKMKAHGSSVSTFSDWWAYKLEVQDAIPYNAAIMQKVGLNVALNSDDAEMARRLNQEAAKSIRYGDLPEEEAWKMVTLNPAKMLHIDKQVGSLKAGKDADIVLWTNNPLSIYAMAEKTIVDGIIYFDREKDKQLRTEILQERNRIIQKMLDDKKGGGATTPAMPSFRKMNTCSDHLHNHGLLVEDQQ